MKFCKTCQCETERGTQGQCRPCANVNNAAYYLANCEQAKASQAAYHLANAEKRRARNVAYHLANPEKASARSAAYRKANPEVRRINEANRRAQKLTTGILSKGLAAKLFVLQKGKCACCKQPLGAKYDLDHIMPLVLGGTNTDNNIQLLRQRCNNQKHAKHPIDFMQQRGFLL